MIFLESRAQDFVCPTSRTPEKRCIGSRCAAWRYVDLEFIPKRGKDLTDPKVQPKKNTDRRGYCGLGGRDDASV
jgi:hypothetical protein